MRQPFRTICYLTIETRNFANNKLNSIQFNIISDVMHIQQEQHQNKYPLVNRQILYYVKGIFMKKTFTNYDKGRGGFRGGGGAHPARAPLKFVKI